MLLMTSEIAVRRGKKAVNDGGLLCCKSRKLLGLRSGRLRCRSLGGCGSGGLGLGRFLLLRRRENGVKNRAFHPGHELNHTRLAYVLDQAIDDRIAKLAVGHLATTETQAGLYLVTIVEKPDGLVLLGLVVMLVDGDGKLDFLDGDDLLLLAGGALTLFLLVKEASIVLDAAHGGDSIGRNFNEVETTLTGDLQSLKRGQDAHLFAVFVDDADFARADAVVDADKGLGCTFIECDGTPPNGFVGRFRGLPEIRRERTNAH